MVAPRKAEARVRRLRTWRGRLARDIARKVDGDAAAKAAFTETELIQSILVRRYPPVRSAPSRFTGTWT